VIYALRVTDVTVVPYPTKLPRRRDLPRQRGRAFLKIAVWLTAIFGILAGIGISLSAGNSFGAGLSMFYALIPLPGLWLAYWWLDRYEPEPRRYKLAAFVWGGVVAVAIALVSQILIQEIFGLSDNLMAAVVAPVTEETAKCAFLLLTFMRMRRVIDGFLDGLIYAGLVGLGFAFIENIGYYSASYLGSADEKLAGAAGTTATFIMRGIFSPFAHPGFTAAFGIALGLAITTFARRNRILQAILILLGLAASIALHGLWNASLAYGDGRGFLIVYLALTGGLLVLTIFAIVVRVRQVHTLEASLRAIAERGWIHPDEIPYLSRFRHRKTARKYAGQHYGRLPRKVVRRYQQLATEAAFLHHALTTGRHVPSGVERTYALLDEMYGLRPHLRLPPALPRPHHAAAMTPVH
jgi:RsiW-degrading membrane proteinase PrsW (M82 family)